MAATGSVKPRNAWVAEAVGWLNVHEKSDGWYGINPDTQKEAKLYEFGKFWCTTGPFVDRFKVGIENYRRDGEPGWTAFGNGFEVVGDSACDAIAEYVATLQKGKQ